MYVPSRRWLHPVLSMVLFLLVISVLVGTSWAQLHLPSQNPNDEPKETALNVILVTNPTTIDIFWDAIDNATDYNIEWSEVDSEDGGNDIVNKTVSFYTINNLKTCTDYLVSVEAMKDEEQLEFEEESTKTKAQAPFPVIGLELTLDGCSQIIVDWVPVTQGNCNISYDIFWNSTAGNESQTRTTTNNTFSIDVTVLVPDNTYTVCVQSSAEGFNADWKCKLADNADIDLDAPTNLQPNSSNTSSISVSWDAPDTTNDCELIQYQIWWDKEMDPEILSLNITQYTITNLTPDKEYTISLVAQYKVGLSAPVTCGARTAPRPSSPNIGAIVGGVVGGLVLLVLVALVVAVIIKRKKQLKNQCND